MFYYRWNLASLVVGVFSTGSLLLCFPAEQVRFGSVLFLLTQHVYQYQSSSRRELAQLPATINQVFLCPRHDLFPQFIICKH